MMVYTSGESYEGNWVNAKKHGFGKYTWKNGKVYTGNWDNGKMEGTGKMIINNKRYHVICKKGQVIEEILL